ELTRSRLAALNSEIAQWELYELDEFSESLMPVEVHDGNLQMRVMQAFRPASALDRFSHSISRLMGLLPEPIRAKVEVTPRSAAEVAFLLHGLEFARARQGFSGGTFTREEQLTFGAGANETVLCEENEQLFLEQNRFIRACSKC